MPRLRQLLATALLLLATGTPSSGTPGIEFECSFSRSPTECGFQEQGRSRRAVLTPVARDGATGVLLRTLPGDNNVFGSGSGAERNDLSLSQAATGCFPGREQWWAHSILFPDGYVVPIAGKAWHWGVVFDFHHTGGGGQANVQVVSLPTGLAFWIAGGPEVIHGPGGPGFHAATIGPVVKNTWYDFVYHVRWSSGPDGFIRGWVNGQLKLNYDGATLYTGKGCYLKLANYHSALGRPVSVIHDRILAGSQPYEVSNLTLEGVPR